MNPQQWRSLRRWLGFVLVAILGVAVASALSNWQFHRRAEAVARIELVNANWDAPPVPIASLMPDADGFAPADDYRPVIAEGEYLTDQQLLARGRPRDGKVGFQVLTPLRLDSGLVLLVDRGWTPAGSDVTRPAAEPDAPSGRVRVTVRLRQAEPRVDGRGNTDRTLATIHPPSAAEILQLPVYTGAYGLLADESPSTATGVLATKPVADEGPHLSYAIQWIIFGILGLAGLIVLARTEIRERREALEAAADRAEDPAVLLPRRPSASTPARATSKSKRRSDAEIEDELLG